MRGQKLISVNQAFIFAAGRGERMRPITDSIPKPLIPIKNKAIIDYTIEKLDKIPAIQKIIINGFYLAEQISEHIKKLNNPKIIFSGEREKIETGGGLVFASTKFDQTQPILTINGDVLWQEENGISDIELLCEAWKAADCDILLGLKKKTEYCGYDGKNGRGDFYFDPSSSNLQRIKNLQDGRDSEDFVFVGLQILNPKILKQVSEKHFSLSKFYQSSKPNGSLDFNVKGVELIGRYFHIGTPESIKKTEENL
jgi:MurNAc alpha-1-phosphate uridylyltransferase